MGSRVSVLQKGSVVSQLYGGKTEVWERHRHRYEVNPDYISGLENAGLKFSGKDDKNVR